MNPELPRDDPRVGPSLEHEDRLVIWQLQEVELARHRQLRDQGFLGDAYPIEVPISGLSLKPGTAPAMLMSCKSNT